MFIFQTEKDLEHLEAEMSMNNKINGSQQTSWKKKVRQIIILLFQAYIFS